MPRKPRFCLPGQPQHIIIRGVNRQPVFAGNDDYHYYLSRMYDAMLKHGCNLHAYVLMTNHIHLLLTPNSEQSVSKAIQMIGRYYVQYFNRRYQRTGTLWEGRYKSALVDTEQYLLICYRYIELNPVRANMVNHPSEHPWSSYRHNAIGQTNTLITPHQQYLALGSSKPQRCESYRSLFDTQIPVAEMALIRHTSNKEWVLGSDFFRKRIEAQLQRQTSPLPRGGDRKSVSYQAQTKINRH